MKEEFELMIEAFACDEYGDSPLAATIRIDERFVRRIKTIEEIGLTHDFSAVYDDKIVGDEVWVDENDDLRMRGTSLVVMPRHGASFFLQGHPKHADYNCETRAIDLKDLLLAVEQGERATLPENFSWKNGRLFYAGDVGYLQDLIENFDEGSEEEVRGS